MMETAVIEPMHSTRRKGLQKFIIPDHWLNAFCIKQNARCWGFKDFVQNQTPAFWRHLYSNLVDRVYRWEDKKLKLPGFPVQNWLGVGIGVASSAGWRVDRSEERVGLEAWHLGGVRDEKCETGWVARGWIVDPELADPWQLEPY